MNQIDEASFNDALSVSLQEQFEFLVAQRFHLEVFMGETRIVASLKDYEREVYNTSMLYSESARAPMRIFYYEYESIADAIEHARRILSENLFD